MLGKSLQSLSAFGGTRSQNDKITEWLMLEVSTRDHLVQLFCLSRPSKSRLLRILPTWGLNTSKDERKSTTSLGDLLLCLITLLVKKFTVLFRWDVMCFSLCLLPLLSLGTTGNSLANSPLLHWSAI